MTRFAAIALALAAGCASPSAPQAPRPESRPDGVVIVGEPGAPVLASCDRLGRWDVGGAVVEHWLYQPDDRRLFKGADGAREHGLFRGRLPFPYNVWQPSGFQVNQLVYPARRGFVAMYHVMNHGNEARTARLFIGLAGDGKVDGRALVAGGRTVAIASDAPVAATEGADGRPALAYDLAVEPGTSRFVFLTTPELEGRATPEMLEEAIARWEKRLGSRSFRVPDPAVVTSYHADLAGEILGIPGCARNLEAMHARLARPEDGALRLLADVPAAWLSDTIEVADVPTPFGPLTLKHEGAFALRTLQLGDGCRPPKGFRLPLEAGQKATIDGRPAAGRDGVLEVPAGARRIEITPDSP
ncbi:MAG TPA: hypothetical protein VEJ18_14790 [Planctomycetota bacterium]|nr:hypothetical protein [Planctomycetota bacterium]